MSLLEQLKQTQLTPEETQELVVLLDSAIPKVRARIKQMKATRILEQNLNKQFSSSGNPASIESKTNDVELDALVKGELLLVSAMDKLKLFNTFIKDLTDGG